MQPKGGLDFDTSLIWKNIYQITIYNINTNAFETVCPILALI